MVEIESVLPSGRGHWILKCYQFNWSRKEPICITSTTEWIATTNDSVLIDEYKAGITRARKQLIRFVKTFGTKKITKE
jgi:hypothetical protein